jgi:hypothetical protein
MIQILPEDRVRYIISISRFYKTGALDAAKSPPSTHKSIPPGNIGSKASERVMLQNITQSVESYISK